MMLEFLLNSDETDLLCKDADKNVFTYIKLKIRDDPRLRDSESALSAF